MSQSGVNSFDSSSTFIETLTGNSGGAVPPDGSGNIDILGNNVTGINIVGTPASNLLTVLGISSTETQRGTVRLATSAETLTGTSQTIAVDPAGLNAKLGTQTLHALPIGGGSTAALTWTAAPTNGQLLIGSTGADPILANLTSSGGTITITNGAGTINLDLAGGGIAFEQITVDANTAPGTNPVLPSGTGQLTLTGAQVATGTVGANVIRSSSLAANSITLQIQRSTAVAATDSTKNGVSHFDSAKFTVDASGFVSASGTGIGQTITGNSGGALSPTAGNWNILGASTASGTTPVSTSGAVSTLTINVQKSQAIASTDATKIGLSCFDSASFSVDANGFVTTSGTGVLKTLTGNSGGALSPTAGNINTLGTGSITIAGAGSTLTTQLTGLTNHNVLIGAGTATITNVAPSATSGVPLISQGAAADPAFGTAVVAGGGTGNTTFTAYSVICAGTTATGAFQNVSGLGTSGQVLTSNGAGTLPTWQAINDQSWTDNSGTFGATLDVNYFLTAASTVTLPGSPAQGDHFRAIVDTTGSCVITANTGQTIRYGSSASSVAGTLTNSARGDAIWLVYRSTGSVWITENGMGAWTPA